MKFRNILLASSFVSLMSVSVVSAAGSAGSAVSSFIQNVADVIAAIVNGFQPISEALFGSASVTGMSSSTFLTVQFLLAVIIFALVYTIVDSIDFFSSYTWVQVVLSIAVSVLSVRALPANAISAIFLPYQALGIVLSAGVPFIIYFTFVEVKLKSSSQFLRKLAWIFFGVIFVVIYLLSDVNNTSGYTWIYLITALLAFVMLWLDGTVQRIRLKWNIDKAGATSKQDAIDAYKKRIAELPTLVAGGIIDAAEAERRKKDYQRKVKAILKL